MEEEYTLNKITEAEWFETRNAVFNPFYPARYSVPRNFHRSYVCEPRRNLNNGDIEFLLKELTDGK